MFSRLASVVTGARVAGPLSAPLRTALVLPPTTSRSSFYNIPDSILSLGGRGLHLQPGHPLCTTRTLITSLFPSFDTLNTLPPIVTTYQNFDSLLTPIDHPSRRQSDTYYIDGETVLRCHTSAHQVELLRGGARRFLVAGDVFRRDTVDSSHYPVFHQMEGVCVHEGGGAGSHEEITRDLKERLEGVATALFGADARKRWTSTTFPFTDPSFELEVFYNGDWLEVLGCGNIHPKVLANAGLDPERARGWAFGLGLERLAMVLFSIPDIRLFWTQDRRFLDQFKPGVVTKFVPYSKYPACYKDLSFWVLAEDKFSENDLHEEIRGVGGDLVESAVMIDSFTNKKTGKLSQCFRINYQANDRVLTNEEIDVMQAKLRGNIATKLKGVLELR
jgi:phenylalanyl-tRNA synthetase alpha chain